MNRLNANFTSHTRFLINWIKLTHVFVFVRVESESPSYVLTLIHGDI